MQWVVVTGDSRGLGQEITRQVLAESTHGVIGISRAISPAAEAFRKQHADRYVHLDYDLDEVQGIRTLYLEKIKAVGPLYGLVNNSAMAYDDIVTNLQPDRLAAMFRVNVFSAMQLTKYAIRDMLLHKTEGSIVHVSSVSAHTGYKGLSMYAASKGALEAFSKGVAREWGSRGIRSNCVVPGFMETAMSAGLGEEQRHRIYQRTALKKETDIRSVASAVVFLLSERAKSVTGIDLRVDNGSL